MSARAKKLKLGVLISGAGSGLANVLEHVEQHALPAEVAVVISSRARAGGLAHAEKRGVPTLVASRKGSANSRAMNDRIHAELEKRGVELVLLLGFLSLFEPRGYRERALNIHPALLPAFGGRGMYGRRVHAAVLARGAKVTGATLHFVDEDLDTGPIFLQRAVNVQDDDTPETLAARVQAAERELVPQGIRLIAEGRVRIEGGKVRVAR